MFSALYYHSKLKCAENLSKSITYMWLRNVRSLVTSHQYIFSNNVNSKSEYFNINIYQSDCLENWIWQTTKGFEAISSWEVSETVTSSIVSKETLKHIKNTYTINYSNRVSNHFKQARIWYSNELNTIKWLTTT